MVIGALAAAEAAVPPPVREHPPSTRISPGMMPIRMLSLFIDLLLHINFVRNA
jgi:hypothetical protein